MLDSKLDLAGENPCSKGDAVATGGVVLGYSASSGTPWQFCLKRVGYDCIY